MKNILIAILLLSGFAASAQSKTLLAAGIKNIQTHRETWHNAGDSIYKIKPDSVVMKKMLVGTSDYILTTNATPTTVKTITITDETAGVMLVMLSGKETGTAGSLGGIKAVQYNKNGGTLTLGTVGDVLATTATGTLATATWTITTSSNNIVIQITGVAATNAEWVCFPIQTKQ